MGEWPDGRQERRRLRSRWEPVFFDLHVEAR
jgi:hypothetical protein